MSDTPEGHAVVIQDRAVNGRIHIRCECGDRWTVSEDEYNRGIDHVEDHYRYVRKQPTKPD